MTAGVSVPFPEWDGRPVHDLTVAPDGTVHALPTGTHERLHRIVVGDRDPTARLDGDDPDSRGRKVELALAGWVQLRSDRHTDRMAIDAPDGFEDAALIRRFARLHDAGALRGAFHPSGDGLESDDPRHIAFSRAGERVPVEPSDG